VPDSERDPAETTERSLAGLVRYFLGLGTLGFGGPIALVGYMQRDLVDERGWFSDEEYKQGLALAQAMPGPLAAQLAMWFGYLQAGWRGALAVAVPFVGPPFLLVTGIAVLYAEYQGLNWVQSVFTGVAPVVLAIVAVAAVQLARRTNERDPVLWTLAALIGVATVATGSEIVWLFLAAGAFGAIYYGGGLPAGAALSLNPALLLIGTVKGFAWSSSGVALGTLAVFFLEAGALTFGSGLAVIPFLQAGLVEEHGWITQQQFVDAVAMGLITPGPVVIMATFAGYLAAGIAGAVVATVAVFAPVYLFVVVPGRTFRRHAHRPRVRGFITGATAAAAGAIAGAAVVIGQETIDSWWALPIGVVALVALLQRWVRIPEPALVAAAAALGLLVF
jgi:chromate transporter